MQKPPLLLVFDDIDSLEFMRQATGGEGIFLFVWPRVGLGGMWVVCQRMLEQD